MYCNGQYYVSNWVARGTQIRQYFHLLGCLQPEISTWISRRSKASCPPQWGWASLNLLRDKERGTKSGGTRNLPLFSCLADWAGTSYLTLSHWTRRIPSVRVVRPLDSDWTALPAFNPTLVWFWAVGVRWDREPAWSWGLKWLGLNNRIHTVLSGLSHHITWSGS